MIDYTNMKDGDGRPKCFHILQFPGFFGVLQYHETFQGKHALIEHSRINNDQLCHPWLMGIEQKRCPYIGDYSGRINCIDGLLCNGLLQFILLSRLLVILAGDPL